MSATRHQLERSSMAATPSAEEDVVARRFTFDEIGPTRSLPPVDHGKQAYLVLLGCSLMQLPAWGFAISYGVFQEHFAALETSSSSKAASQFKDASLAATGIIGTTLNGIMYLSMPLLFGLFTQRLLSYRKHALVLGLCLLVLSLVLSAFATSVWQLVVTQGVVQAVGAALLYSASAIYLDEWFITRKAFAFGVMLSAKSVVGVSAPVLFSALLNSQHFGNSYRNTLLVWTAVLVVTAILGAALLRLRNPALDAAVRHRRLSWSFLRHPTFYVYQFANIVFSASYGMPQTYLSTFASGVLHYSTSNAALMLAALNIPSVAASYWFGLISDGGRSKWLCGRSMSIASVSFVSAIGASLPVFLFWGLVPTAVAEDGSPEPAAASSVALLTLFAVFYGFFAGGYSATWGGVVKEISKEGERFNEAVDTGLIYGLLNGGRGIGYVTGGLAGVELLKVGAVSSGTLAHWASYGSNFGSIILFTGCGAALGGVCVVCRR